MNLEDNSTYSCPKKTTATTQGTQVIGCIYTVPEKWEKICSTTLSNYVNMEKRLSYKQKFSDFILVYYSIFLIINTLSVKYFPTLFDNAISEYLGVIISIVLLAYSLINSNARYSKRIDDIIKAINKLKTIKREITNENIKEFKKKYYKITDGIEMRSDCDFFCTIKASCKKRNIPWHHVYSCNKITDERLKDHLSEIDPVMLNIKNMLNILLDFFLITLPPIAFILSYYLHN